MRWQKTTWVVGLHQDPASEALVTSFIHDVGTCGFL
ncbi:hypothetical protein NC651_015999 [Populus alba x Populus x berolinensis]|nr:hypothetical protein NC651_015999 [Populus alba x Populus x berolinensis]